MVLSNYIYIDLSKHKIDTVFSIGKLVEMIMKKCVFNFYTYNQYSRPKNFSLTCAVDIDHLLLK